MGLIRDKIAGTARESVKHSVYSSDSASGFDELPTVADKPDNASNARTAEKYLQDNVSGTNIYVRPRMHK